MISDRLKTLLYPLDQGTLSLPPNASVLCLGAEAGLPLARALDDAELVCVQGFRPTFLALKRAGLKVVPEPEGMDYDAALVLCGKHRGQNEAWIAQALTRTRKGGLVIVGGAKTDGVVSLHKRLSQLATVAGRASKHHGLVFWLENDDDAKRYINDISSEKHIVNVEQDQPDISGAPLGFQTASGMFSHQQIDPGSRLLVQCLPERLKGAAADFCAGWGYLSVALALRDAAIKSIDLYEADHASLEAARVNMASLVPEVAARFFWHDLVGEDVSDRYDLIVLNPPFHAGRAAEPALGEAIIARAARCLKLGGRLFVVANRQLPYERTLATGFAKVDKVAEQDGFKVFCATR